VKKNHRFRQFLVGPMQHLEETWHWKS